MRYKQHWIITFWMDSNNRETGLAALESALCFECRSDCITASAFCRSTCLFDTGIVCKVACLKRFS